MSEQLAGNILSIYPAKTSKQVSDRGSKQQTQDLQRDVHYKMMVTAHEKALFKGHNNQDNDAHKTPDFV
ncbi:hypothetical protein [Atlantibacter hermannii]|uniref:hypothetical protein n=1 Tax=Atlantibacter hermannii TaxID=565 RepID=UPI00289A1A6A|nr:hypothetical protein [Atlantibacter hermannii]